MSRSAYERQLEDVLSAIGASNGGDEGFCVTFCLAGKDLDTAQKHAIPMPIGWQAEIMDISRAYATEASDAAETLSIGILDGDEDCYVAATVVPIFAIGNTVERLTILDGVTGHDAIPGTGAPIVVTTTSVGTVGIADFYITIRFFR